jgi:hypothetical protein
MTDREEGVRGAGTAPAATTPNVGDRYRLREMRRASRELDQLLGVQRADHVEPDWSQYALGWNERGAAA